MNTSFVLTDTQRTAINYAKAIGILLVVIGHFTNSASDIIRPYIFHMPLFFFIGGVVYKEKSNKVIIVSAIKRYWLYLLVCYVITGLVAVFFHHYFGTIARTPFSDGILSTLSMVIDNKFNNNPWFIFGWFLLSYPLVIIIANIYNKISRGRAKQVILFIALASYAYYITNHLSLYALSSKSFSINLFCQISVGLFYFILGATFKEIIFKINGVFSLFILVIIYYSLCNMGLISEMGMSFSRYPYGFLSHTVGALIGIAIIFNFAILLSSTKKDAIFEYIGLRSKDVMTFHMLAFSLIDTIFIMLGIYTPGHNPGILDHYYSNYSFPIYFISGIFISIGCGVLIERVTKGWIR
ncbi:acyltransferase family protein [Enterobacter sichuanensis]|uniref:acyltransferase family protein n=1 Tax=Enterobacter sichuanensis TaxID=2071710 RepID=UPI0037546085